MYPLNTRKTILNQAIHIYGLSYDYPDTILLFTMYRVCSYTNHYFISDINSNPTEFKPED